MLEKKIPLMVELIGEPESGKTHFCLTAPNPVLVDTTPKQEGLMIAMKLYPEDWKERYFRVASMKDVRDALRKATKDGRKSFCVDWGGDLLDLAAQEWLAEESKRKGKTIRAVFPIGNYRFVNQKIIDFFREIADAGMNIVLTAGFKDEYLNDKKSGARERDGYRRMDFFSDIRIFLKLVDRAGVMYNPSQGYSTGEWARIAYVVKNRFVDRSEKGFKDKLPTIDYDGLLSVLPEFVRKLVVV